MEIYSRREYRFCAPLFSNSDSSDAAFNALDASCFEGALASYWSATALPMQETMARWRGDLMLHETRLEPRAAASTEAQPLDVALRYVSADATSVTIDGSVFSGDEVAVRGELTYVFVDADSRAPTRLPGGLPVVLEQFEAGARMVKARAGDWIKLGAAAREVRRAVFVREQGIVEADEWDDADLDAVHVVVTNRLGRAVATGRIFLSKEGEAHIGRVAVLQSLRGQGIGRLTMEALEETARLRGVQRLHLSAQRSAESFYRHLAYQAQGEPYEEVGILHIAMQKRLDPHVT